MSIQEPKNKAFTRVLLVVIPLVVLFAAYFLLFHKKEVSGQSDSNSVGFVEPTAEGEKNSSLSKVDIYEKEIRNKQSDEQIRSQSNFDDLFEIKEKKKNPEPVEEPVTEPEVKVVYKSNSKPKSSTTKQKTEVVQQEAPAQRRQSFYSSTQPKTNNGSTTQQEVEVEKETTEELKGIVNSESNLKSGQTLRIRVNSEFFVNGVLIPKYTVLSGLASVSGERMYVTVTSIQLKDHTVRCKYEVYDTDGVKGLYLPATVNQDIAKQSASGGLRVTTRIPVFGGTVSGGTSQKIQDPVINVPIGYNLILIYTKQQ